MTQRTGDLLFDIAETVGLLAAMALLGSLLLDGLRALGVLP